MATPGGHLMSVAMTSCGAQGWVTDRRGYRYTTTDPQTGHPWPPMPPLFLELAQAAAAQAGYEHFTPDACLINRYEPGAKMTPHQDKDEADFTAPIVSISLGLAATFLWGGAARKAPTRKIPLTSGDTLVWGGPARLQLPRHRPAGRWLPCLLRPLPGQSDVPEGGLKSEGQGLCPWTPLGPGGPRPHIVWRRIVLDQTDARQEVDIHGSRRGSPSPVNAPSLAPSPNAPQASNPPPPHPVTRHQSGSRASCPGGGPGGSAPWASTFHQAFLQIRLILHIGHAAPELRQLLPLARREIALEITAEIAPDERRSRRSAPPPGPRRSAAPAPPGCAGRPGFPAPASAWVLQPLQRRAQQCGEGEVGVAVRPRHPVLDAASPPARR